MSFAHLSRPALAVATVAAAALLSAGTAVAQEATPDTWTQIASTKNRADVHAEVMAARQSGLTNVWSRGYIEPLRSDLTRAEVRADTASAIATGERKAINARVYRRTPFAAEQVSLAGK